MNETFPTESLRRQHFRLTAGLARMWILMDNLEPGEDHKKPQLLRAIGFLEKEVTPHAEAEDCFLYPEVGRIMNCHRATATMNMDHEFVSRYIRELRGEIDTTFGPAGEGLSAAAAARIRATGHRLGGLLRAHFAKEEELYLPLLAQNMTAEEIRRRITDPMGAMIAGGLALAVSAAQIPLDLAKPSG